MKLQGIIGTVLLSLILAAPVYAQEQHDQEEQKDQKEQTAKPAQDEKRAETEKSAKQDEKGAQQEKNSKPEEKNAQQENTKPEEKNAQQQLRINRRTPCLALAVFQLLPHKLEADVLVDQPQQMALGFLVFQAEVIEQRL